MNRQFRKTTHGFLCRLNHSCRQRHRNKAQNFHKSSLCRIRRKTSSHRRPPSPHDVQGKQRKLHLYWSDIELIVFPTSLCRSVHSRPGWPRQENWEVTARRGQKLCIQKRELWSVTSGRGSYSSPKRNNFYPAACVTTTACISAASHFTYNPGMFKMFIAISAIPILI